MRVKIYREISDGFERIYFIHLIFLLLATFLGCVARGHSNEVKVLSNFQLLHFLKNSASR